MKKNPRALTKSTIEQWTKQAEALPAKEVAPPAQPVVNYLQEAEGIARVLERNWKPRKGMPGLRTVAPNVPLALVGEIHDLVELTRLLQTDILYPDVPYLPDWLKAVEAGRGVAAELRAALEYVLADGIEDDSDAAFDAANKRDDGSAAALAQALSDYAGIGERNVAKLKTIEGFNPAVFAQARELAAQITAEGPQDLRRLTSEKVELRNRVLMLLEQRLATVRKGARYVFRKHPELLRQVTSAYSRKQRAAYRRKVAQQPTGDEASDVFDQPMD
jgi:hypothetical protein